MIIKKFILILVFFAITNCGYSPIYSKKETLNISINKIELKGNKNVNRKIVSLANLVERNNKSYAYNLTLDSNKKIETVARDKSGNTSIYKITIITEFYLKDPNNKNKIIKNKSFSSSFSYNSIANKFDLLQYQKNIEENLINKIAEEITIFINS
tara:strand:- start:234 stop:698 length:465 start_codon:yes stop_codon:yes gene_type:complete